MKRWATILCLLALLAGAYLYRPVLPSLCGMKRLTGLSCPGCGMTRSVMATVHGRLGESVRYHVFGPLAVVLILLVISAALFGIKIPWEHRAVAVGGAFLITALLGYWLVRLYTGSLP